MSALYADITSDSRKTAATSRGHRHITSHTRGWDFGVRVVGSLNSAGEPVFELYRTSGSNGGGRDSFIGTVDAEGFTSSDEERAAIWAMIGAGAGVKVEPVDEPEPVDVFKRRADFLAWVEQCGKAAGSWVVDGNTSTDTARAILRGIEDGDPATLDSLPSPRWGGEWADEPTYEAQAAAFELDPDEADELHTEAVELYCRAAADEVERACREILS